MQLQKNSGSNELGVHQSQASIVRLHRLDSLKSCHEFLMSDGTKKKMTFEEARRHKWTGQ